QHHRLQHRQAGKELADLERAREPELHAAVLAQRRDPLVADEDVAPARRKSAGEKVDESRLAGAVGTDQRVARALRKREGDIAHRSKSAEAAREILRAKRGPHRRRRASAPMMPPRAKKTNATRRSPSQNCQ